MVKEPKLTCPKCGRYPFKLAPHDCPAQSKTSGKQERSAADVLDELSKAIHQKYVEACEQQKSTQPLRKSWILIGRIRALEEFTQLVIMMREIEKRKGGN